MMVDAGVTGTAVAKRRRGQIGEVMETVRESYEAPTIADHGIERSEFYVTAPVESSVMARSYKHHADHDEYVTARRRRLEQLPSEWENCEEESAMQKSQEHWTEVGCPSSSSELLEVANRQHFRRLVEQDALSCARMISYANGDYFKPSFFMDYGDALQMGDKIGEGGQADIFKASIHGQDQYVVKVLKPGFSLADLERQLTVRARNGLYHGDRNFLNCCFVESCTLLRDGRLAFVMQRFWGDLRKLIDQKMLANNGLGPPFLPLQATKIMHMIATGMKYLHSQGIVHRDLKASNVLLRLKEWVPYCVIADFESSVGIQGTGFWRAPEVLEALKNRILDPCIFTKKVDVYSYAMTSYEVLTGRIPFGDRLGNEYDGLLRGERPLLPDYVEHKVQEVLKRCWHSDPLKRPTFCEICCMVEDIYNNHNRNPRKDFYEWLQEGSPTTQLQSKGLNYLRPALKKHSRINRKNVQNCKTYTRVEKKLLN